MEKTIPELEAAVHAATTEQDHIDALNELALALLHSEPQRGQALGEEARKRATTGEFKSQTYLQGLADSLHVLGCLRIKSSEFEKALPFLLDALSHYREIGDLCGEARALINIGGIHYDLGNYPDALECQLRAIQMCEEIDRLELYASATNIVGLVYHKLGDLETARTHFQRCLEINRDIGNTKGEADALDNLGNVYLALGKTDQALEHGQKSLELYQATGNQQGVAEVLISIGRVHAAHADYPNALACYNRCLTLSRDIGNRLEEASALLETGKIHLARDKIDPAIVALREALAVSSTVKSKQQLFAIHEVLTHAYKQAGDFEKALLHYEKYHTLREQVFNETTDRQLKNLRIMYQVESAEKEAEIYQLRNIALEQEIARRTRAEAELHNRLLQLTTVLQVYNEVSSTLNIDNVQLIALDAAVRLSGADGGFIALVEDNEVRVSKTIGNYSQSRRHMTLDPQRGVIQRIITSQKPLMAFDLDQTEEELPTLPGAQARIIIPLFSRDQCAGLVNLETGKPERFTENVFQLLQILEQYISMALDNAGLYEQTQSQLAELQRLYYQVSELEQLKSDMIRVAAHDLRNPLGVIYTYMKLLDMDNEQFTPDHLEYFDGIRAAAVRMSDMLQDILSLERIEQMADLDTAEAFNMSEQVEKALAEHKKQAADKSLQLEKILEIGSEPLVQGDRGQIYEAIVNLLGNAIKYTPENGQIVVSLKSDAEKVVFQVQDTGYGIPEELQERLFQPFYRAKIVETQDIDGTGLGLHLVKNIIDRHKGRIIFDSVYGKGSMFGFVLPRF